jgi:ComF family protein
LQSTLIDVVAPVPLYWLRRWRRGYDQSAHLAECVASRLKKPLDDYSLRRVRATATQHHLSPTRRKENVRGAFAVRKRRRFDGRSVLLVDDVLTTGATCHQAARALKAAGASHVYCLVLARGDKVAGLQGSA